MSEIVVTDEAGLRTIRIDRPDKKNALTRAMYAAMGEALRDAATSPAVRVVFITGGAACFTSGNDVADSDAFDQAGDRANGARNGLPARDAVQHRQQRQVGEQVDGFAAEDCSGFPAPASGRGDCGHVHDSM